MDKERGAPWLFAILTLLILLAGGVGVGLAAWWVVAPQAGETVELEGDTTLWQTVEEPVFYPWDSYDMDSINQELRPDHVSEYEDWYFQTLIEVPLLLGFEGGGAGYYQGQAGYYVGMWKDCPVTSTEDGQSALLDVAFCRYSQQMGMTWVARSTGELPTQEQRQAARAKVEEDVRDLFVYWGVSPLDALVSSVETYLVEARENSPTQCEEYALAYLLQTYGQVGELRRVGRFSSQASPREILDQVNELGAGYSFQVQLVTTQRQVITLITSTGLEGAWATVAVYYDIGLEQYSGLAINGNEGYF